MNWLRSRAKQLTLLALFALALQLGLSFGHAHHDRAFAGKTAISDQASAPSRDNGGDTDGRRDLCAICATVALAQALIDSVPPVLPLPLQTAAPDSLLTLVVSSASPHPLGFQSRAPPQS